MDGTWITNMKAETNVIAELVAIIILIVLVLAAERMLLQ